MVDPSWRLIDSTAEPEASCACGAVSAWANSDGWISALATLSRTKTSARCCAPGRHRPLSATRHKWLIVADPESRSLWGRPADQHMWIAPRVRVGAGGYAW